MSIARDENGQVYAHSVVKRYVTFKLKSGISRKWFVKELDTKENGHAEFTVVAKDGSEHLVPVDEVKAIKLHDTDDQARLLTLRDAVETFATTGFTPEQLDAFGLGYTKLTDEIAELEARGVEVYEW